MSSKEAGNNPGLYPVYGQLVLAVALGWQISFRACLWVFVRPHHIATCWLSVQHFIFYLVICLETPTAGSVPTSWWTVPSLASTSIDGRIILKCIFKK